MLLYWVKTQHHWMYSFSLKFTQRVLAQRLWAFNSSLAEFFLPKTYLNLIDEDVTNIFHLVFLQATWGLLLFKRNCNISYGAWSHRLASQLRSWKQIQSDSVFLFSRAFLFPHTHLVQVGVSGNIVAPLLCVNEGFPFVFGLVHLCFHRLPCD